MLWVNDIEQTITFYRNLLGFSCLERSDGWACLERDGIE
jgi:catechol 2,3-dioxygenase-like lactoylglutathione lyase family enzyme